MDSNATISFSVQDIILILQGIILGFAVLFGFIFRYILANIEKRFKSVEARLDKTENKADSLSVTVPTQYVTKLEFSRVIEALFEKMDGFGKQLGDLLQRISKQEGKD